MPSTLHPAPCTAGEIVLMPSAIYDQSKCSTANSPERQYGDYLHPPDSSESLTVAKYKHSVFVVQSDEGPIANFTLLSKLSLTSRQSSERRREEWPMPTTLAEDAYSICYKREFSSSWVPQGESRLVVGKRESVRITMHTPTSVFPEIDVDVFIHVAPIPGSVSGQSLLPGAKDPVEKECEEAVERGRCRGCGAVCGGGHSRGVGGVGSDVESG